MGKDRIFAVTHYVLCNLPAPELIATEIGGELSSTRRGKARLP
jgi:hypothetical protein